MVAMMTAVARHMASTRERPRRDLIFTYFADEEAAGILGAKWMVNNHREVFEGATAAIGELGGFSVEVGDHRLYPIQIAEKGLAWMRLTARGKAGHGSRPQPGNAVLRLSEAIARLGRHEFPVHLTPAAEAMLREAA